MRKLVPHDLTKIHLSHQDRPLYDRPSIPLFIPLGMEGGRSAKSYVCIPRIIFNKFVCLYYRPQIVFSLVPIKNKLIAAEAGLVEVRFLYRDKRIVHCHGVFDVLHAGHLAYFQSAKALGDILIVTITADRFVNKGPGRPFFTERIRAQMLAALEIVDFVFISQWPTAVPCIEFIKPNYYVKGPDYRDREKDVTKEIYNEERAVQKYGGQIRFTSDETFSSSTLANRFLINWTDEQMVNIELIKRLGGYPEIEKIIESVAKLKVLVVGEPIIDTYRFCEPENISSKSPSVSARYLYEENYLGGSFAIANHLADLVEKTFLLFTYGGEPNVQDLMNSNLNQKILLSSLALHGVPTPRKTRYIAIDKSQRIFEITHINNDQWEKYKTTRIKADLDRFEKEVDLLIFADFGHGLFEGPFLKHTHNVKKFKALNVQTNSSNFGFNSFKKHKSFQYLSIDTREARIAHHDRFSSPLVLAKRIAKQSSFSTSLTLGKGGAYYLKGDKGIYFSPSFTDSVVDATGAGDAYFALTSVLQRVECHPSFIPFLGNVFAGLKTKIIGNKSPVTKAQLLKTCHAILK